MPVRIVKTGKDEPEITFPPLTKGRRRFFRTYPDEIPFRMPGFDYATLGAVMQNSIHPGGDVYLDGRTVGQVISGIQGRSYRALQRSGWQK